MTAKDYTLIAARLRASRPEGAPAPRLLGWTAAVEAVADALAVDNYRFDRARFFAAAGAR